MLQNSRKTTKQEDSVDDDEDDVVKILTLPKCFCVVFLVAFVCFINTLDADFVYDDTRCILKNQDLLPTTPWTDLLYNDFWGTPLSHSGSHKSYRPLCVLTFRMNFQYGGLNPQSFHFFNNILHCIVSCLFVYLCYGIYEDEELALLGGLLFAVHPIHTEAVAGVVGRADVGAAFFFILSVISYRDALIDLENVSDMKFASSMLLAVCSTFTKEQGITVLGVLLAYELLFISKCNLSHPRTIYERLESSGGKFRVFVIVSVTVAILFVRFLVMGNSLPDFSSADNPAANEPVLLTRVLTFLYLPVCNMWLLIYPYNLCYDYSMYTIPLVERITSSENLFSLILYASLLSVGVIYLRYFRAFHFVEDAIHQHSLNIKKTTNNNNNKPSELMEEDQQEIAFRSETLNQTILGLAMLILPFLPATNLFFYVGFIVAERILYIPSIGFCLLVVNGVKVLYRKYEDDVKVRSHLRQILAVTLILFAVKTYNRNFVWKNEESLYRSGLLTSPAKSYGNLANILVNQGRVIEGEEAYRKALQYRFNMADTHYNLGILLQNSKRCEEAIKSYRNAIKYRPRLAAAHLNLGVTLMNMNQLDEALDVLYNASEISDHGLKDPHQHAISLTHIRYNMGKVLHDMQRYEEALGTLMDALDRMPDNYERHSLYNMIGQSYSGLENHQYAEPWYYKALHEKPDHVPALLTVARQHMEHTSEGEVDWKRVKEHLEEAISLEPQRVETYLMYASYLEQRGDFRNGIFILKKALKFQPKNIKVLTILSSLHRNRQEYDESMKYLSKAQSFDPKNPSILMNIGALQHLIGNLDQAEVTYNQALEIDPGNEILLDNIQRLKKQKRKLEENGVPKETKVEN